MLQIILESSFHLSLYSAILLNLVKSSVVLNCFISRSCLTVSFENVIMYTVVILSVIYNNLFHFKQREIRYILERGEKLSKMRFAYSNLFHVKVLMCFPPQWWVCKKLCMFLYFILNISLSLYSLPNDIKSKRRKTPWSFEERNVFEKGLVS